MKLYATNTTYQKGAALVVSLIMLLILTLIGVTGMQTTVLEEKMAGNARDYNLAFQSAETALRDGETYVESLVTAADFQVSTAGNGLFTETDAEPDYLDSDIWNTSSSSLDSIVSTASVPLVSTTPRYILKYVTESEADSNAAVNIGGYGEKLAGAQVTIFKVTSRGTGGTDTSQVILQSFYGKRF